MLGMNKTNTTIVKWILVAFMLAILIQMFKGSSTYALREIKIKEKNTDSIAGLPYSLECVPGAAKGSPYTKDLTPGGACGIQKIVYDQSDYEVVGGIGEPLI
jgi:hypothetical protein